MIASVPALPGALAICLSPGLLGPGGSIVTVPAIVLPGGLSMHHAVATSLVIIAMKFYSGFYKYLVVLAQLSLPSNSRALAVVTSVGVAGSFIGRRLRDRIPRQVLRQVFGGFQVIMAVIPLVESTPQILFDQ